jgi:Ca-activated chloride channel homolog
VRGGRLAPLVLIAVLAATATTAARAAEATPPSPDLPHRDAEWLEEVALLISAEEREIYLALGRDYQRQAFRRAFWQVRDPFPATPANELRDRWQPRVEEARRRWGDLEDDRARMLLLHGPPASRIEARCGGLLRPLESWSYGGSDLVRGAFTLVFVQPQGQRQGRYRLWSPGEGLWSLFLFAPAVGPDSALARQIEGECVRGGDLLAALGAAVDWTRQEGAGLPHPGNEWARTFAARSTDLPANVELLAATIEMAFPRRHQSRTVVQGVLKVPLAEATAAGEGEARRYRFLVDGEVLRGGELFESFRYRFDLPAEGSPAAAPLIVERVLRPGPYRLVLRLEDLGSGRFFRHEADLVVPLLPPGTPVAGALAPSAVVASATASAAVAEPADTDTSATPTAAAIDELVVVQLVPPPPELLTGRLRVDARVSGPGVARVRFLLDGRPLLAKSRAPYSVAIDLGAEPRLHTVTAVAEDAVGAELARDEVAVNAGPHRLAVRLVEPRAGSARAGEPVRAQALVEVPAGERLERVELFLDETLFATLYQPPFVQELVPPVGRELSYVRAVAHLAGGVAAEDVVFLAAPRGMERLDVDLVELYTTVVDRRGRPLTDLGSDDFTVLEDGEPQELLRCELLEDLPIHAAILLDTSTSMLEELAQAERAALRFFDLLLTSRDRAAVMTFADRPRLQVPFTSDPAVLAGGLAGLAAEGETALYDSLVYALWYFSGVKGKRVLVLLSDGEDVRSRYGFEDVLRFARRSGVAIYTIGLGLPSKAEVARAALQRLASETGGTAFWAPRGSSLDSVYATIERELRSQYLLAYQPRSPTEGYHEVKVEVRRPGARAITQRGYHR